MNEQEHAEELFEAFRGQESFCKAAKILSAANAIYL